MKAVITVIGKDMVGILAKVSTACAESNVNVVEVTQSILDKYFAMIMLVDIAGLTVPFTEFVENMEKLGRENGLEIVTMHEDIFNAMHKI